LWGMGTDADHICRSQSDDRVPIFFGKRVGSTLRFFPLLPSRPVPNDGGWLRRMGAFCFVPLADTGKDALGQRHADSRVGLGREPGYPICL
jgi:hypothetical protein